MTNEIHPVVALLDSLGNDAAIAEGIGKASHVPRDWKRRKSIPLKYWPDLYPLGLTSADLLEAHGAA